MKGRNAKLKAESGEWVLFLGRFSEPRPQMHFARTKSPENTSSGCNCFLLLVSRFHSVEPLDATGGTLSIEPGLKNTGPVRC